MIITLLPSEFHGMLTGHSWDFKGLMQENYIYNAAGHLK